VLSVENEKTKLRNVIILRGSWLGTECTRGACINLIGQFDQNGQCVVDDTQNLLIVEPDHLISATVVADSFSCLRRAVLQDRVKATSQPSESTVYGSMLHEIFQDAMRSNRWDTEWFTATIKKVATRYIESLFELNVTFARAVDHLSSKVIELQAWAQVFVAARPKVSHSHGSFLVS
jgi:DNA replication ATP-dependent helicase Dna2